MTRKRRHACRVVQLRKLDQPVFLAAYTQDTDNWREWHGRRVTVRKAQEMVAAGEAQSFTRQTANGIETFFQETQPTRASRATPEGLTAQTTAAVMRRHESDLDHREQAQIDKFLLWPFEYDRRNASTVRPRFSESHRVQANKLLKREQGVGKTVAIGRSERHAGVRTWHATEQAAA